MKGATYWGSEFAGNVDSPGGRRCPATETNSARRGSASDFLNALSARILTRCPLLARPLLQCSGYARRVRRDHVRHAGLGAARRPPALSARHQRSAAPHTRRRPATPRRRRESPCGPTGTNPTSGATRPGSTSAPAGRVTSRSSGWTPTGGSGCSSRGSRGATPTSGRPGSSRCVRPRRRARSSWMTTPVSATCFAISSEQPFDFRDISRGDHWDYPTDRGRPDPRRPVRRPRRPRSPHRPGRGLRLRRQPVLRGRRYDYPRFGLLRLSRLRQVRRMGSLPAGLRHDSGW